jgi:hypothetical protein
MNKDSRMTGAGLAGLLLVAMPATDLLLGAGLGVVHGVVALFGFVLLVMAEARRDAEEI